MATAVIVDQETREEALLIEPEGQYIVKSNSLDPDFRLYSQTRFSKFKLKLRQNDDDSDVLRCVKTGATVNLTTDRGILVVETSRKDGKDLCISKYVQIKQIVEDILHGKRSPLVRIPMSGQRKAVKGLMAKKRDCKAMAASEKELSTETAAPPCEGRTSFSNAFGSTGNGATGRCAGGEGGENHPQSRGGNGKIDGGGNTAIDFTSAFKIGYKGQ
jgi:hypothetical protein